MVIERDRQGDGFRLVTPSWRLAARASAVMRAEGLFGFVVAACKGRGRKAGRPHGQDCYDLPLFRPFAEVTLKRRRTKLMGGREFRTRAAKGGGR